MPELTIVSAASRMRSSVMKLSWVYQWFHPIGGVSARVSPTTSLKLFCAWPRSFLALNVILYSPFFAGVVPVIMPVFLSRVRVLGRFLAWKVIGRVPVVGIR